MSVAPDHGVNHAKHGLGLTKICQLPPFAPSVSRRRRSFLAPSLVRALRNPCFFEAGCWLLHGFCTSPLTFSGSRPRLSYSRRALFRWFEQRHPARANRRQEQRFYDVSASGLGAGRKHLDLKTRKTGRDETHQAAREEWNPRSHSVCSHQAFTSYNGGYVLRSTEYGDGGPRRLKMCCIAPMRATPPVHFEIVIRQMRCLAPHSAHASNFPGP